MLEIDAEFVAWDFPNFNKDIISTKMETTYLFLFCLSYFSQERNDIQGDISY